jgi:signal transduction histidine kinase
MACSYRIMACVIACLAPTLAPAAGALPRSILVLNESAMVGPFYQNVYAAFRSKVLASSRPPIPSMFLEQLVTEQFQGDRYEQSLKTFFESKYAYARIGVIVAFGFGALDYLVRSHRPEIWSDVPIAFVMVGEADLRRMKLPPEVTGRTSKVEFGDLMKAARAVVPNLQHVAIVGDRWEQQNAYRHFSEEIPSATSGLDVIDLVGLPMRELRKRVAALPERTAIIYTSIFSDGEGTTYPPVDALALITEAANRPVVVAAETFLGRGAIGGYVLTPKAIGEEAANLALRILDGESASSIPIAEGNVVTPMFDWRQMQRWGVSAAALPSGSEIRFRDPTMWEQYRWQVLTTATVLLAQTALIFGLAYEHRRRRRAEVEARQRMSELAHVNRQATVGELYASIAHELNQPLGAILANVEALELMVGPNMTEVKEMLADIKRDDVRAAEVIRRLRAFLKGTASQRETFDLNETTSEAFDLISVQAHEHNVVLSRVLAPDSLRVTGDRIQLQQVILNLILNGIDAVAEPTNGKRYIVGHTGRSQNGSVEISVSDSGPGIPPDKLGHVFEPFFTTKQQGMGIGLSIARTIVEAHGGRIWVENQTTGGAIFRVNLPPAALH